MKVTVHHLCFRKARIHSLIYIIHHQQSMLDSDSVPGPELALGI